MFEEVERLQVHERLKGTEGKDEKVGVLTPKSIGRDGVRDVGVSCIEVCHLFVSVPFVVSSGGKRTWGVGD